MVWIHKFDYELYIPNVNEFQMNGVIIILPFLPDHVQQRVYEPSSTMQKLKE